MKPDFTPSALLRNACGNTAAFVAQAAFAFALTPAVLRALGDARFGAWSFVESFIAYLTLFDLGVAAALVRFVPRQLARGEGLDRYYSAALVFFIAAASAAVAVGATFEGLLLDRLLQNPTLRDELRWLFRVLVINFAVTLPLSVYPATLDGLGQFVFKGSVRIGVLAARVPLTLLALRCQNPLLALGCVVTGCNLAEHLILAAGVWQALPGLRFRPRSIDRATLREVGGYSLNAFAAMIAGRLSFHTDAFVIGPVLGPTAITLFCIPAGVVERAKALLRSGTNTLTAAFSALEAAGDEVRLRQTFLAATRWAWYAALPAQAGLLTLGHPFLSLWVGEAYADACTPTLLVLASVAGLTVAQSVAARLLYGTGRLRQFVRATVAEGVTNLLLSMALIGRFGVLGVAAGTAIPHALFCVFVMRLACRRLSVPVRQYSKQVAMPIAFAVPLAVGWAYLAPAAAGGWVSFLAVGLSGIGCYAAAVTTAERLRTPVTRRGLDLVLGGASLRPPVGAR